MPPLQMLEVSALVGTADERTERLTRKVFSKTRISKTAASLTKAVDRFLADASQASESKPLSHEVKIVIVDLDMPKISGDEFVRKIREKEINVPIVLVSSEGQLGRAALAIRNGAADYVLKPVNAKDLLARVQLQLDIPESERAELRDLDFPLPYLVEKLHDPSTGRLDATRVASFLGVNLAELSRALGTEGTAVYKTPASRTLQERLRSLESIASGLVRLLGSETRVRMWMHSANPALDKHAPIELLKMGKIGDLAGYVQDLLEGRPA